MIREKAVQKMKDYFSGVPDGSRYIEHTLKVLKNTDKLLQGERVREGFVRDAAVLSAIFHDIGIPVSMEKFGSSEAKYQEKEGEPIARRLMEEIGVRADVLERVCYIVEGHHTQEKVDGVDFQIIWEADFVVNIEEKNIVLQKGSERESVEKNILTGTGKKLVAEVLPKHGGAAG